MRTALAAIDHLVLATPDLLATAAWIRESTGVSPSAGGQHLGLGSRNMLCSLGDFSYLEIVGPDPDQDPPPGPRPFGIDNLTEPGLVAWAIAVSDIAAAVASARGAGYDPGDYRGMDRRRPDGLVLSWQLTVSKSRIIPFLIDWGASPHPARDAVSGLTLHDLSARHPDPATVDLALEALGVTMAVDTGLEALLPSLEGPRGSLDLTRLRA
jgi:hypothetical protein